MRQDRPLLGVTLMLGFCALAPLGDSFGKILGATLPLGQVVLARFVFAAIVLGPLVWFGNYTLRLPPRLIALMLIRSSLTMAGLWMVFLSLRYLPIADAIAIAYVMPFVLLLMGKVLLGEEVGPRRLAASAVGFAGTMMVMQPSFAEVGWVAALPLSVAVIFAAYMLVTRLIAHEIDPVPLQAITGVMGTMLLLPLLILVDGRGWADLALAPMQLRDWPLMVALGALGTFSHLFMIWALRFAPAATVAPMQYIEIPFAVLYGWLIFDEFPGGMALLGIAVVMAAGLYVIRREQITLRDANLPAPPAGPPAAE